MTNNYFQLSVQEVMGLLKEKSLDLSSVLKLVNHQTEKFKDNKIFITCLLDQIQNQVKTSQENYNNGCPRPLEGVFIGLKDNIATKDVLTTCASKILHNFVPDYNATIVDKLQEAGAIIIGKTNLDEFAMGSFGNYSAFGTPTNVWTDNQGRKYFCGSSSSGSA